MALFAEVAVKTKPGLFRLRQPALQNLLELPRDPVTQALGVPLTGVLVFLILAPSLVLLLVAVGVKPPPCEPTKSA